MLFLKERIGKLLEDLEFLIYPAEKAISSYKMLRTERRIDDIEGIDVSGWDEIGNREIWGGNREYYWFETVVAIPEEFDGKCVAYKLTTGREGEWDATNPQFSLYVNDKLLQGMDVNHTEALLTERAVAGEKYRIVLSAFTGDQNFTLRLDSKIRVLDRKTEKYFYDCKVPYDTARLLPADSAAHITIISCLNESLNLLDLRREYSQAYYESLKKAQEYITREFYDRRCGNGEAKIYCVGHTHIDVAWLWTLAVTEDKAVRSFSTAIELMREYPEYIFMSGQPQLHKYVKKNNPGLYSEIKERIAEGRWEAEGSMWVEADCNLASGEALVRQLIYGKRFFREEFGTDSRTLWLPDVFGYSAALPQIMDKCGIKYFMTTKLSWNEFNKFPCDTFLWEGIDGTRVLTHFIPARDYIGDGNQNDDLTPYFTTYNGYLAPSHVMGGWQRYQEKHINSEALMAFGYGDGGGGPTREQLENQRRLARGIPGCPQTVMSTTGEFFDILEKHVQKNKYLPTWAGELYLEYHRGTYTSMGRNKKYNRRSEFTCQNAELYGVLDNMLTGADYPREAIRDGWETVLLNQFHDILPGTSIKEVYEESREQYEAVLKSGGKLIRRSLNSITAKVNTPKSSIVVFNPNIACARQVVSFDRPEQIANPVVCDGEKTLATQLTSGGQVLFIAEGVPSKGYKSFMVKETTTVQIAPMTATDKLLENNFFILELNRKGQFSRIYDKRACRELLKPGECGNVIVSYEDRPHGSDAWNIHNYYMEKSWEIDAVSAIKVEENGSVQARVKIERTYLESTITQYISIYRDIPRIDIYNDIDWKEKQILLKALFPVDIHAGEATFDIQYGNVRRPTNQNTSWEYAKFEMCMHKWMDLSEDGYGVSVLNDCKYGVSVRNGVIGLTMLKSAVYPNPDADKERHTFTYVIYPHAGDWREAAIVAQAYHLNNPMTVVVKENDGGILPAQYAMAACDSENVIIETVKKAEENDDLILRLYECYNRRTAATLCFAARIASVFECNMLEEHLNALPFDGERVIVQMKPYEIKTLKVRLQDIC